MHTRTESPGATPSTTERPADPGELLTGIVTVACPYPHLLVEVLRARGTPARVREHVSARRGLAHGAGAHGGKGRDSEANSVKENADDEGTEVVQAWNTSMEEVRQAAARNCLPLVI